MNAIQKGMMLRVILTLVVIPLLKVWSAVDIRIQLYLALAILDNLDYTATQYFFSDNRVNYGPTKEYQNLDKIVDTLSYWYVVVCYLHTGIVTPLFLRLLVYRTIGVLLYLVTQQSICLIVFFDAVKEALLYDMWFGSDYTYLPVLIGSVVLFEIGHKAINERLSNGELPVLGHGG